MHGDEPVETAELRRSARAADDDRCTGERIGRRPSKRYNQMRVHEFEFFEKPPTIVFHFAHGRLLVDAPLAALLKFEMLDRIRDVRMRTVYSCFVERFIEKPSCGPDERTTLEIFLVAWLFADEGERGAERPFAKNGTLSAFDHWANGGHLFI